MNTTIPELSDEQIESMRFAIMTDVGKAARARTRRYRQVVLGAAVVVALGGVGAGVIGASHGPTPSNVSASKTESGLASTAGGAAKRGPTNSTAGGTATDKAAPNALQVPGREIITTGTLSMTVEKPMTTADQIIRYVEAARGRVDSRDETAASGANGGSVALVIRIPQASVSAAIDKFRSFGKVDAVSLAAQDVTTQGQDLDARVKALRISVARLEAIMKDSKSTADLLGAETALSQRQADLDSLVSQRKGLSDQVALSSIQISISASPTANSPTPSGFRGGVIDGWNAMVSAIDSTVHGIGVAIPWGLALVVLGGIAWVGRRVARTASKD